MAQSEMRMINDIKHWWCPRCEGWYGDAHACFDKKMMKEIAYGWMATGKKKEKTKENKEEVWKAIALCVLDTKEMQRILDKIDRLENLLIDLAGEDNELLSKGDIKRALLKEGVIHK